jgi:hypothetical protein
MKKRGRPKGQPHTGGRKKGTLNSTTIVAREALTKALPDAIAALKKIIKSSPNEALRIQAAKIIVDKSIPNAPQQLQHTGLDENPIEVKDVSETDTNIIERADQLIESLRILTDR